MKIRLSMWKMGLLGIAAGLGVFAFVRWHGAPTPPTPPAWADLRAGDGCIHSLASGTAPDGEAIVVAGGEYRTDGSGFDLRIVCYHEADGAVRWESRIVDEPFGSHKVPSLEVDRAGDILVGWRFWSMGMEHHTLVEKLSGVDGHRIWAWWRKAPEGFQTWYAAVPKTDAQGRVWVAEMRQVQPDEFRRFLVRLDPGSGNIIWEQELNDGHEHTEAGSEIQPLSSGDGVVLTPPSEFRSGLWLLQKVAASNGAILWTHEFQRGGGGGNAPPDGWGVDEAGQQVITLANAEAAGVECRSFALADGAERWARDFPVSGAMFNIQAGSTGSAYVRRVWDEKFIRWWRWHWEGYFWRPEEGIRPREQSEVIRFSTKDGAVLQREPIAKADEMGTYVLRSADGRTTACLICSGRRAVHRGQWRWLVESGTTKAERSASARRIQLGKLRYLLPTAMVTNSGHVVMAGNLSGDDARRWEIRAW